MWFCIHACDTHTDTGALCRGLRPDIHVTMCGHWTGERHGREQEAGGLLTDERQLPVGWEEGGGRLQTKVKTPVLRALLGSDKRPSTLRGLSS